MEREHLQHQLGLNLTSLVRLVLRGPALDRRLLSHRDHLHSWQLFSYLDCYR